MVGYWSAVTSHLRVIVGYGACDGRIIFNLARVIVGYNACDGRIFQGGFRRTRV